MSDDVNELRNSMTFIMVLVTSVIMVSKAF